MFPATYAPPIFSKFKGKGNPKSHLMAFCTETVELRGKDDLLIRLFPRSLADTALDWYTSQPIGSFTSLTYLAEKFVRRFFFNTESQVSFSQLQATTQKPDESLFEFVVRWREGIWDHLYQKRKLSSIYLL